MIQLLHPSDPDAIDMELWHWVYLHGKAETHNEKKAYDEPDWRWEAADLCCRQQPLPKEEGDYEVELYGLKCLAVVRKRGSVLGGRVAALDDEKGLAHAKSPEEWR